ncbi:MULTISPECIES: Ger(x)C family spore germination protein [unclassified Bacillus (in: firmicutes)]|uniref:Ger(x)C family spore germination protein n=1 Tax=unclassified Bacillus (in: firmicutes) TaxID=185979 RepID=UPI0008E413BE|nr:MULTISPECIES: Ger(x)C family spore germination protein [unclassified Bacillus (in: firmicutes)]SFK10465.1 spore germination protein [Bacillus sp. 71mf]SFT17537.1 spore germination protein [Bacillus sp. 103mf]
MENFKKQVIFLFCLCLFLTTACVPKSIIDDISLIQGAVFDVAPNTDSNRERLQVTYVCPIQRKGNKVQVLQGYGNTIKQVKTTTSLESGQPLANGQIRVTLFTEKLAKKGLSSVFDTLIRDVNIGNLVYIGILEGGGNGEGKKLLLGKYNTASNVAIYIKKMLEQNMKSGDVPSDNLYMQTFRYYREGQDTYMPILKKKKNSIKITSIALFKQDKYVGKVEEKDMFLLKTLLDKSQLDSHEFKTKLGYTTINNIRSSPSYHVYVKNGKPSFVIRVKMAARIQEISKHTNLENKKNVEKIRKDIVKKLNTDGEKLVKKLQSLGADPLALGARFKQHYRPFQLKEWRKMYKDVPVKVQYDVDITNSGVIE